MNRFLSLLFLVVSSLSAFEPFEGHELYIGPEYAKLTRKKEGSSEQSAEVFGACGYYQRWVQCGLFLRGEGYHVLGKLDGTAKSGPRVYSHYHETWGAAALGWSFEIPCNRPIWLAPYAMYGRFRSSNHFKEPTPMLVEIKNRYHNAGGGLAMRVGLSECITLGFDFRGLWMWNGKSKVVDDPDFGNLVLLVNDEPHYYAAMPLTYAICDGGVLLDLEVTPYYWYRHLGGRENYPDDFIEARYRMYGLKAGLAMRF